MIFAGEIGSRAKDSYDINSKQVRYQRNSTALSLRGKCDMGDDTIVATTNDRSGHGVGTGGARSSTYGCEEQRRPTSQPCLPQANRSTLCLLVADAHHPRHPRCSCWGTTSSLCSLELVLRRSPPPLVLLATLMGAAGSRCSAGT